MPFRRIILALMSALLFTGCTSEPPDPREPSEPRDAPSASPSPEKEIDVEVVTVRSTHVPSDIQQRLEHVRVTGLPDHDGQQRINQLLRAVPEQTLDDFEDNLTDPALDNPDLPPTTTLRSTATVGLRGPDLVSAAFHYQANGGELARAPELAYDSITIDLETEAVLSNREMLSKRVRTPEGARELGRLLRRSGPDGELCGPRPAGAREFQPSDFVAQDEGERTVWLFPQQQHVTFAVALANFGYPMSCARQNIDVDYRELNEFLAPAMRRD